MTFYSNRKQEYVLTPRRKALYEDANSFGTKMLQKMGWEKGKGLGANLDGNKDFIKVNHKSNQAGFGFQDRDDQWTQHEDNFNSLLNSFKTTPAVDDKSADEVFQPPSIGFESVATKGESSGPVTKASVYSGVSLEEQSKKSKARVHYKKFTRGKDLARYSEKDLANIFGKKTLNDKHAWKAPEEVVASGGEDIDFGVTFIQTGTSVNDYFRAKMEAKLAASNGSSDNKSPFNIEKKSAKLSSSTADNPEQYHIVEKIKSKKSGSAPSSKEVEQTFESAIEIPKKSKKNKKSRSDQDEVVTATHEIVKTSKSKLKSGQSLNSSVENVDIVLAPSQEEQANAVKFPIVPSGTEVKEKKKKKRKSTSAAEDATANDDGVTDERLEKKSKRSKKKSATIPDEVNHKPIHFPILLSTVLNSLYAQDVTTNSSIAPTTCSAAAPATSSVATVDVFEMAKYKAEVFRFFDFAGFGGASNLCDIPGYGYSRNLQLRVVEGFRDDVHISNFWDLALVNKYGSDAIKIKKVNKRKKYNVNVLKKKNVFKF